MPSLFAELESLVSEAIDTVYGEPTRIERVQKGQVFAGSASSSIDRIGIVDINPVTVRVQDEGSNDGMQPQLAGEKIHVSYDESSFAAGEVPEVGNKIVAFTRPGAPAYLVTRVDPDGIGRFICVCKPA